MESRFHKEIEDLKMLILQMAALTYRAMQRAVQALLNRDLELSDAVIEGDQEINLLEVDVDRQSLRLLALDQPMARDLRFIVGCMRIAVDLERIADQAVSIAQRAKYLSRRPPLPQSPAMEQLAETALDMISCVIAAFSNENAEQASDVCRMDDRADELNATLLKNLLDYMVNEAPAVARAVQTIIVARCFERAADQATNIAESVIFIVNGVNVKHHCE